MWAGPSEFCDLCIKLTVDKASGDCLIRAEWGEGSRPEPVEAILPKKLAEFSYAAAAV